MDRNDMQKAIARIQAGHRATLIVPPGQMAAAQEIFAKLPARYRDLLTLAERGSPEAIAAEKRAGK